jgi:hypothetical protein
MKPLATPVLGGMVSSLLHVLVVTPVIFFWLHERRLGLQRQALPASADRRGLPWRPIVAALALVVAATSAVVLSRHSGKAGERAPARGKVVQQVSAGSVQISLVSPTGTLHQGRNAFTIEFRSADGRRVDPGVVRASGNMPMPGMVMSSGLRVQPTDVVGRYEASAEFGMAGAWHMAVEWEGPAGKGSVNFEGMVQ